MILRLVFFYLREIAGSLLYIMIQTYSDYRYDFQNSFLVLFFLVEMVRLEMIYNLSSSPKLLVSLQLATAESLVFESSTG